MKEQFVGHVEIDGQIISDVEAISPCNTKFVTSAGSTSIDWTTVTNPAARTQGARDVLPITSSNGEHDFSAPNDSKNEDLDERMEAGLGLLYLNCEPAH